jgi:hypothetical protein
LPCLSGAQLRIRIEIETSRRLDELALCDFETLDRVESFFFLQTTFALVRRLNFSSADNAGVHFQLCFRGGFSGAKALLLRGQSDRLARSPHCVRQPTLRRTLF